MAEHPADTADSHMSEREKKREVRVMQERFEDGVELNARTGRATVELNPGLVRSICFERQSLFFVPYRFPNV